MHGFTCVCRPVKTYIDLVSAGTKYLLEDLPKTIGTDGERESGGGSVLSAQLMMMMMILTIDFQGLLIFTF